MVIKNLSPDGGGFAMTFGWLLAMLMWTAPLGPWAVAQPAAAPETKYDEMPVNTNLKRNTAKVNQMLSEGKFDAGGQQMFDDFYQQFLLPQWTHDLTNLPKFRHDLANQLRKKNAGAPTTVHDHLNSLLLEFMQKLAAGNYHPVARVNAMLMIGDLNRVEQPPTPLPEALTAMIAAVQSRQLSDAVRAVAMVGIKRHLATGTVDEDARKALTAAMLKVASDPLPRGPARDGREWILRQALDVLGRLGTVGDGNAVFTLLAKALADEKLPLQTRMAAADALGRLNYTGTSGINAADMAAVLGQFAIDVCTDEVRQAKASGEPVSRQRIAERLGAALAALAGGEDGNHKGIGSLAGDANQQASLAELQKNIESMTNRLSDKQNENENLSGAVEELQTKLEAWLKKKG
jgi:hypothetical protein